MNSQITVGINAVSVLVKKNPSTIDRLLMISGKKNKRLSKLIDLARTANVCIVEVSKEELEGQVRGVHQGVAAFVIEGAVTSREISSAALSLEILGNSKSELLLVLEIIPISAFRFCTIVSVLRTLTMVFFYSIYLINTNHKIIK